MRRAPRTSYTARFKINIVSVNPSATTTTTVHTRFDHTIIILFRTHFRLKSKPSYCTYHLRLMLKRFDYVFVCVGQSWTPKCIPNNNIFL